MILRGSKGGPWSPELLVGAKLEGGGPDLKGETHTLIGLVNGVRKGRFSEQDLKRGGGSSKEEKIKVAKKIQEIEIMLNAKSTTTNDRNAFLPSFEDDFSFYYIFFQCQVSFDIGGKNT